MGTPGDQDDIGRLRGVLELLDERDLLPRRVRVGTIEIDLVTSPPFDPGDAHPIETERELKERLEREYEAMMYGASEGPDFS